MKQEELVKGLKVLGIAFSKEFTQDECATYYEFLQEYTYETFKTAVKNIIKKSKFLPKISELVEECENCKEQVRIEILHFMREKGYFKYGVTGELPAEQQVRNYEKASRWLTTNIIPDWFKEDLTEYYKMMNQEKLSYNEQLRIGQG